MKLFGGNKKLILIHTISLIVFISLLGLFLNCWKKTGLLEKTTQESPVSEKSTIPIKEEAPPPDLMRTFLEQNHLIFENCPEGKVSLEGNYLIFGGVDLNEDNQKEYFITPWEICGQQVRGASGNGPIFIYEKIENNWAMIASVEGSDYLVFEEKTDGYHDFRTHMKDSADSGSVTYYKYLKEKAEFFKYFPINEEWYYYNTKFKR